MPVKIEVSGDDARHAQREMLDLLRGTAAYNNDVEGHLRYAQNAWLIPRQDEFPVSFSPAAGYEPPEMTGQDFTPKEIHAATGEAKPLTAARERGQPSPGKARRTKAEIAEDETADKADADRGGYTQHMTEEFSEQQIGTGEERISPEDEADAAVDAADEAAETEATGGLVPRERLRKALGALGIKAGVEAVKPGGLLGMAVQDVPEDQIEAAIAKLEAAKQVNFVNTGKSEPTVFEVEKPATKDELMAAMLDYAEIFDGTRDPKKAVLASEDCGKVFKLIFGDEVASMSKVPADQYDKAIAGIREAITKNPYDRERKG